MRHVLVLVLVLGGAAAEGADRAVTFEQAPGKVFIKVGGEPFATYVYEDARIPRPYFCDLFAPNGVKVTRNNPPVEGQDATDHDTYHPGLWLAFGDINGNDTWRNKAKVVHLEFTEIPLRTTDGGSFAVQNAYEADGKRFCIEKSRYTVVPRPEGTFLLWETTLSSEEGGLALGDQEEMGLGVRMATPLTVEKGGAMLNSDGLENEDGVWGKQAAWCDYAGTADGKAAGVLLAPHPGSGVEAGPALGPAWFHARDYGLLVANHFGRNAFTQGEKSRLLAPQGRTLRLRYGVVVHGDLQRPEDLQAAYAAYLDLAARAAADEAAPARPEPAPVARRREMQRQLDKLKLDLPAEFGDAPGLGPN